MPSVVPGGAQSAGVLLPEGVAYASHDAAEAVHIAAERAQGAVELLDLFSF